MVTYDSGADGHYLSEKDQRKAGCPISQPSTRTVGVPNSGTSKAKHVTQLPFHQLSAQAMQADTFQDFPTSLMSVGKTADDGTVSVFTKEGVNLFKEEDVLITCKGEPIFVGVRDSHGQNRIPLMQQPTTGAMATAMSIQASAKGTQTSQQRLQPPIDQTSHQMDARRMWLSRKINMAQSHQSRQLCGLDLLNESNVQKYYPETIEAQKGHLNQTRKNMRSTKAKQHLWKLATPPNFTV